MSLVSPTRDIMKNILRTGALALALSLAGCSGGTQGGTQGAGASQAGSAGNTQANQAQSQTQAQAVDAGEAAATSKGEKLKPPYKVYIASIVDHPSLLAVRDGAVARLKELGYKEGEDLIVKYASAQGNPSIAGQIAKQFVSESPTAIISISTPLSQAMVAATKDIPIVFGAISDPVAAKLVPSLERSGTNVTGASDIIPADSQVAILMELIPNLKKVGLVYSPGEINSASVKKDIEAELQKKGIELVVAPATRTSDIPQAVKSLAGKVDVIYSSLDNNISAAYESMFLAAKESKTPIVSADTANVPKGAILALGVDFNLIGKDCGNIVNRIINGEKPGDIPTIIPVTDNLWVNTDNAKVFGVTIPESIMKRANNINGKDVVKGGAEAQEAAEPAQDGEKAQ